MESLPTVRLIAFDMDGTLLGKDSRVSPGNARALEAAHAKGIELCAATGRNFAEIGRLLRDTDAPYHCIAQNGAMVRTKDGHTQAHMLGGEHLRVIIDAAREAGVAWMIGLDEGVYMSSDSHGRTAHAAVDRERALELARAGRVTKALAVTFAGEYDALARVRAAADAAGLAVSSSGADNIEINAPGVSKGGALQGLAERLGIPPEEVMALGDYENDIAMLRYAGVSVAMGNALETVKKTAKYETLRNDEDGVAAAIYRAI